jgi:hypothetical protein
LPNVKELSSITDKTRVSPAIDVTAFPATPSSRFWTSTPYAGNAASAWYVGFGNAYVYGYSRSGTVQVRLVR